MAMEALPSNDFLNFLIYDTLSATPIFHHVASSSSSDTAIAQADPQPKINDVGVGKKSSLGVQGVGAKKKKRKRARSCKNKEEAETQRMTHIVVERNRRKQMNEHLSVLRSLMPQSYAQRGDQASIVGGAIEFVKELEHILQSLEAQKSQADSSTTTPFSQFFTCPQYTWSQSPNEYTAAASSKAAIEVTLIETHANIRILSKRSPKQPYKIVFSFQAVHLTILHLSITAMDSLVFYSISAKVEEGCPLNSVDDIAGAVHHMLRIIEQEEDAVDVDVDVAVAGLCS